MFTLEEVFSQNDWDAFLIRQPWVSAPQMWIWGELHKGFGRPVRRFHLREEKKILVAMQVVWHIGGPIRYWAAQRGPVLDASLLERGREENYEYYTDRLAQKRKEVLAFFIEKVESVLRENKIPFFFRYEPMLTFGEGQSFPRKNVFQGNPATPPSTRLMALVTTEDMLLERMHQKTRYNIRLAERHGVTTRLGNEEDLPLFLSLMKETGSRDGFAQYRPDFLGAQGGLFLREGFARLRIAEWRGIPLAANLEIMCGDTVSYLHGGSSSQHREVMAPYALHWAAIRSAKSEGYRLYDFWGENPPSSKDFYFNPRWNGLSVYKERFGGGHVSLIGTLISTDHPWRHRLLFPESWLKKGRLG